MSVEAGIPWNRYGLIAELACRLDGESPQFGKTALQKMVYLLQEALGIDCGYHFQLYSYGPFDARILQDLDLVEYVGGVEIHQSESPGGGYEIRPGPQANMLREKAKGFLQDEKVKKALDRLVREWGPLMARDLELRSTVLYVARDMKESGDQVTREGLLDLVRNLKPKFSHEEIKTAIQELSEKGFLEVES